MNKKYELAHKETINVNGELRELYRIKALKSFGDVREGDFGGLVRSEDNLAQKGNCWIYDNSIVCSKAIVHGDAKIRHRSIITCDARVFSKADIFDSKISGNTKISGTSQVRNSEIKDNSRIMGKPIINNAIVSGKSSIISDAEVFSTEQPVMIEDSTIGTGAKVSGSCVIRRSEIGNASLKSLGSYTVCCEDSKIKSGLIESSRVIMCNVSGDTKIKNSHVVSSEISGYAVINNSYVMESTVTDYVLISTKCTDRSTIRRSKLSDRCAVVDSSVVNLDISEHVYIENSYLGCDRVKPHLLTGSTRYIGETEY